MKLKSVISYILIFTVLLSSSVVYAQDNLNTPTMEILSFQKNESGKYVEEIVRFGESIVYSQISESNVISITISDNNIVDFAFKDENGVITYSNETIPLGLLKLNTLSKKNLMENFQRISFLIKEKSLPVNNLQTIALENKTTDFDNGLISASSYPSYESTFRSDMQALGYTDYYGKVVATRYPQGIPATVKENGYLSVSKADTKWIGISTLLGIASATLGLTAGTVLVAGIFIVTVGGAIESAINQDFDIYNCFWNGAKWVELYSQGNYYQAARTVYYKGCVGQSGAMLDFRSDIYDTYYKNDTQLCELAAQNY